MNRPPTLIINTYGGSLLKAAIDENHPVMASLENAGYGVDTQQLNFPDVPIYPTTADWPIDIDLRDAIVIAHPPCSGFSSQNRSKRVGGRGALGDAFACTLRLLEYVMPREPRAIALESVPQAMEGARHLHDFLADAHGYDVYRILQNACSFGVPQWRRRFWAIFVKQSLGLEKLQVDLNHRFVHVGDVLDPETGDTTCHNSHRSRWNNQRGLLHDLGLNDQDIMNLLSGPHYGSLLRVLSNARGWGHTWQERAPHVHKYITGSRFTSGSLHILNPNGFAGVLLASAWWWFGKRMLGYEDYKVLMGFPKEYRYAKENTTLEFLSRGVCPPVARWILRLIDRNVYGLDVPEPAGTDGAFHTMILPGEVADTRPPNSTKGAFEA